MSTETELKLSLDQSQIQALLTLPFWKKFTSEPSKQFHLGNTYFDTEFRELNQARVALRIREKEGVYFQTLKTKGESINGLTRRGEWEWQLEQPRLDLAGLAKVWPESAGKFPENPLTPLFSTDFDRTCWLVEWPEPKARIEAALDIGVVRSGALETVICELELELLEGEEAALHEVAALLSSEVTLKPMDKSKAERGFELLALQEKAQ